MTRYKDFADEELITRLKAGDEQAYTEIYYRYVVMLTGFTESKLYSLDDARDLIHDLFTRLWSERATLTVKENLKAYLFAAARNQIINKIRKNVVREDYADKLRVLSPAYHSLEEELNAKELEANIKTKLNELSDKTKYIYQRSRDENKSIKEIAEELQLSDQTVKNQLSIALKHLRRSLSGFFISLF